MITTFKPVKLFTVKINFRTVAGVQMKGGKYPASGIFARHIELLVPATNERVSFSKSEVV